MLCSQGTVLAANKISDNKISYLCLHICMYVCMYVCYVCMYVYMLCMHLFALLRIYTAVNMIFVLHVLQSYTVLNPINPPNNEEDYCLMEQTDDSKVNIYN